MKIGVSTIKDSMIVVDTNIFIYTANEDFGKRSGDLLLQLVQQGNRLVISEVTILELLWEINDEVRKKFLDLITSKIFTLISIDSMIISNAAILRREYHRYGVSKVAEKNIKSNDLIIGATVSVLPKEREAYLLTCDRSDFCEPLWSAEAYIGVKGKESEEIKENVYLLKINHELIASKHKETVPRIMKKFIVNQPPIEVLPPPDKNL